MPTTAQEWGGYAAAAGILLCYLALHVFAATRLRRGWRIASLIPLPLFAVVLYVTVSGFLSGSNLWPVVMIVFVPAASLYLIVLIFVGFAAGAAKPGANPPGTPTS